MQMLTFKLKPKTIFGIILALTGVVVILLTFVGNHGATTTTTMAQIDCSTEALRSEYLTSLGWQYDDQCTQKQVLIPSEFNQVYTDYNAIQKSQGFDLEQYKGKTATIYTYTITNYEDDDSTIIADLMVYEGVLIASDLCNPDAEEGFLVGLSKNDNTTT